MKKIITIIFILFLATSSFALPESYKTNKDGWMALALIFSMNLANNQPSVGLEFEGNSAEGIGLGCTFMFGERILFTLNGNYYFDSGNPQYAIPVKVRLGAVAGGLGVNVASGIKYFATDLEDGSYLAWDALFSVDFTDHGIHYNIEGTPNLTTTLKPTNNNYYYVYY